MNRIILAIAASLAAYVGASIALSGVWAIVTVRPSDAGPVLYAILSLVHLCLIAAGLFAAAAVARLIAPQCRWIGWAAVIVPAWDLIGFSVMALQTPQPDDRFQFFPVWAAAAQLVLPVAMAGLAGRVIRPGLPRVKTSP